MFSKDDVAKADKFAQTLAKAKFDMSVSDWLSFHQQLIWYNQLIKKIQEHVFEVEKVHVPEPEPKPKTKKS
jgi:hypothetical protein